MAKALIVSDMHIFAARSEAKKNLALVEERLQEVDCCVLNGDIFDFRWSQKGSPQQAAEAAKNDPGYF